MINNRHKNWHLKVCILIIISLSGYLLLKLPKKSAPKISNETITELINEQTNNGCIITSHDDNLYQNNDYKDIKHNEQSLTQNQDLDPILNDQINVSQDSHKSFTPNKAADNQNNKYHIFFDIRHILLHSSGSAAAKIVGVSNMFWYTVKHQKAPNHLEIQARLFEFMDYCTKQPRGVALFNNEPMPKLLCEWLSGKITSTQLLHTVWDYKTEARDFFVSSEEKNLVLGAMALFKPDVICQIQRPITKMIKFFQKCCLSYPNKIYILSNWDRESAMLIVPKFPQIFAQISPEHILLSGNSGKLKPDTEAFADITTKLNLEPAQCILIDYMPENIRTAKELGWQTILYKNAEQTISDLELILGQKLTVKSRSRKNKKHKHLEN